LMVGGYAIYNFSGDKTKPQAENNLSETIRSNDGNKIEHPFLQQNGRNYKRRWQHCMQGNQAARLIKNSALFFLHNKG